MSFGRLLIIIVFLGVVVNASAQNASGVKDSTGYYLLDSAKKATYVDFVKAEEYLVQTILFAERSSDSLLKAASLKQYGILNYIKGDFEKAQVKYRRSKKLYSWIDSMTQCESCKLEVANLYNNLALIESDKGNNRKAIFYHQKSEEIRLEIHDSLGLARLTYPNMSGILSNQGNYLKALEYILKALSYWELKNDKDKIANSYDQIGVIHEKRLDFRLALQYYLKALSLRKEAEDKLELSYSYNNIGVAYIQLAQLDSARRFLEKSLVLKEELFDSIGMASTYLNLGIVYENEGEYEKSLRFYKAGNDLFIRYGRSYSIIQSLINIGSVYYEMGDKANAVKNLLEANDKANELELPELEADACNLLSIVYASMNNYKQAYSYQLNYKYLSDSLLSETEVRMITKLEMQYDFNKKMLSDSLEQVEEIRNINFKNQQREAAHKEKSQRQRMYIFFIFTVLAFVIVIVIIVFRSYRLKQKTKRIELERKSVEIEKSLLRLQMNPHFIFNALNSIQSFVVSNNSRNAEIYLAKFAKLMRLILQNSRESFVCFADELETVRLYLDIESMRFPGKLEYRLNVDENIDSDEISVPPMLIQPFIENAIIHGVMPKDGKGLIVVDFELDKESIICEITDNGIGREKSGMRKEKANSDHKSIGIQVTSDRLKILEQESVNRYQVEYIDLKDDNGNSLGTKVLLQFPFRELDL
ncbi:MAG: hypothetical protein C0594_12600 [Marinilabiliales bacterium]|nr:MAG: hypothetical protein C0594_12600 [Marinilabiliales bacterium]